MRLRNTFLAIPLFCLLAYSQNESNEYFPLQVGNTWSYQYTTYDWAQLADYIESDSGVTQYAILSKLLSADSTIWEVREIQNIIRRIKIFASPQRTDTSFQIKDTVLFRIIEYNSGNHRLISTAYSWKSAFYLNQIFNDSTNFTRYLTSSLDTVQLSYSTYAYNKLHYHLSVSFKQHHGIAKISFSAPGFVGYVRNSNHTLLQSLINSTSRLNQLFAPTDFTISQNYPNPFNPTTDIFITIPSSTYLVINVYDALGRIVDTIYKDNIQDGNYSLRWDASKLASGIYYCIAQSGDLTKMIKLVLLK